MFFRLSSWEVALILLAVVLGTTAIGLVLGRYLRHRSEHLREPFGVLQAALLGLVGLVLAFGLALAVGRYEARRTAVVDEANAIGTTYLRAQTLPEPIRTQSLERLVRYTDTTIVISNAVPGSAAEREAETAGDRLQRELWALGGQELDEAPVASAPRLYVESLNEMFDAETTRIGALDNRVPGAVRGHARAVSAAGGAGPGQGRRGGGAGRRGPAAPARGDGRRAATRGARRARAAGRRRGGGAGQRGAIRSAPSIRMTSPLR